MATLMNALSTAISKSLLTKMPSAAAEKFDLEEDEFKDFLQTFLSTQLKSTGKGTRGGGVKGKNGKGRITGFIAFSNATRQSVKDETPDIEFKDVGRKLGEMWRGLSDAQRTKWNDKAAEQNEANGLPTPTPTPATKTVTKARGRGKAPVATPAEGGEMKVVRDKDAKAWVVDGTSFVVQSAKNKVVVGKLRAGKVVALSAADVKKCESNGWEVKPAPSKAAPAKPARRPVKQTSVADSDDEADGSDDDDSDDE